MIPIRDTNYQSKHSSTEKSAVIALRRRVRRAQKRAAFKQFWIRFWHRNGDDIIDTLGITLVLAIIVSAFYV